MTNIKVQQKLGIPEFKKLMEQVKSQEGVLITLADGGTIGRVHNAFNLGNKIDAQVAIGQFNKGTVFKFESVNNVYSLVGKSK